MGPIRQVLVAGVGSEGHGDDALGLEVVRALRPEPPPGVRVEEVSGDLTALVDLWDGMRLAVVVDAMRSSHPPGTIERIDPQSTAFRRKARVFSTHGISLSDTVDLGKALARMPERLVLFGVEGRETSPGAPLSPAVRQVLPEVVLRVREEVKLSPASGQPGRRRG